MQPETLVPVQTGLAGHQLRTAPEEEILRNFAAAIGRRRFDHWFQNKTRFRVEGDELIISVDNPFLVNWLPQNFRAALLLAAQPVLGLSANVRFEVADDAGDGTSNVSSGQGSGPSMLKSVLRLNATMANAGSISRSSEPSRTGASCDDESSHTTRAVPLGSRHLLADAGSIRHVADAASVSEYVTTLPKKPVLAVSRVTKDPQLTVARVKPVADVAPRHTRRYADLVDFVAGACNEFALAAAKQVCLAPGAQFTTMFVHGPVGVGKTHLLEGICREIKSRFNTRQVVYLTAEAFANFFTQALREHKLPGFRQRFRSVDVLIIDDIDFLAGKPGIQEEFLYTVQQLEAHGRQLVVAAHGHPRLLTKLSDELRTRFLAGMVCRIDAPDSATRLRILETKSLRNSIDFSPDVLLYVAERFKNNVRELVGAFHTLCAYQKMQGRRLSVTSARQVLADLERDCIRVVRLGDIEQAVCSLFGVTLADLKSGKRQKSLSQPRMLAMYLARKHTRSAYAEIGDYFGGRNHSTVIAAEKRIAASLKSQEPIKVHSQTWRLNDLVEALEQQLQAG